MGQKAGQIRKAAERLFAAGRYHEVTLDAICKEAGVGKGTVYRYFKDKEGLFWQVIASGLDELAESVEAVAREEQDAGAGLRKTVCRIAHFYRTRHSLFRLVWGEQFRGSAQKRKLRSHWGSRDQKVLTVLAGFISRGMDEGRYRTDLSAEASARLLLGMVRTALRHRTMMPEARDMPEAVVRLFENGLSVGNRREPR